jgi:curved DNA-binding protein CbpA
MSYDQYVITTFMKAGSKILPVVVSIVVGYFVFIKLPFWFFRNTLRDVRKMHPEEDNLPKFPDESKVMRLEDKIRRDAEELKKEKSKFQQQQNGSDRRKEEPKTERRKEERKKEEPKKEEPKREPPKRPAAEGSPSPESVFELIPGQKLSESELKARYHELLKQSHPDRVASMGPEFRKLAEKKTKEINDAYQKLKKKAS